MSVKSVEDRVKAAFGENGNSGSITAKDFLQQLHSENHILRVGFRSSLLRLFFFFGLFILLSTASVSEATIGPIKITDLSIIIKILPLLAAANYFELVSLLATANLVRETTFVISSVCFKSLHETDLDYFFDLSSFAAFEKFSSWVYEPGILKSIDELITFILTMTILFAAILFECYAFFFCFSNFGFYDLFVWIILFLSLIIFTKTGFIFYCLIKIEI
jgi:hypothetical protein